jgi:hypothetical protein
MIPKDIYICDSITLPNKNVESILFVISLVLPHLRLFSFGQLTAACCTQRTHVCKKEIIEYKVYVENIPAKFKLEALTTMRKTTSKE